MTFAIRAQKFNNRMQSIRGEITRLLAEEYPSKDNQVLAQFHREHLTKKEFLYRFASKQSTNSFGLFASAIAYGRQTIRIA